MGRRKGADLTLSVPVLLNEAQKSSASGHLRYAKVLWDLAGEDPETTLKQILFAMKLFMTVSEKNIYQERILRFFATFVSETKTQDQLDFVEALLQHLVRLTYVKEPAARWRVCQLVHCIMGGLPGDADVSDDTADLVQEAMLQRLDDSKPNIRAAAVRALARLPIPDDDGDFRDCPVTIALLDLLASEKSKDVRKAVLASLPAAPSTQSHIFDRTRDESDDVRRVTYLAIAEKVRNEALGSTGGALLVRRGLGDRSATVSEAATTMVISWLDNACGGEPLALLRWLSPESHPEEAELAVKCLIDSGRLNAVQVGKLAGEENLGLRADYTSGKNQLMSPEEALFWRVICECLASEATSKGLAAASTGGATANIEAAAAGDRLEALESALPLSVEDMIGIITAHIAGGPEYMFAATQFMNLAAHCMDFTDATGRKAASSLLHDIFTSCSGFSSVSPSGGSSTTMWMEAAGRLLRKVHAAPHELAEAVLTSLGDFRDRSGFINGMPSEAAWLHALQVSALMLESLPTARPALHSPTDFTLTDLVQDLIIPGVSHANADVRCEAVRCLGLYCLLDGIPISFGSHLNTLRAYMASPSQPINVRAMAARALGDLSLQRGPKHLDSLLANHANEDALVGKEPTVDLMMLVLNEWQDAFAAATSSTSSSGRRSKSSASNAEIEASAELGTCIVEAFVRLVAVNEFRQAADGRRGEVSALEDGEILKLLVTLLLLHFDAKTESAARMRQCLSVFFERFACLSVTSQQYLATAALPAARSALANDLAAGRRTATSSPASPQVIKFILQLLQLPVINPATGKQEPLGHEPLAELVLGEILGCTRRRNVPKPYLAALCKLPLCLPMYDAGEDTRETMVRIQVYASQAANIISDRTMSKDMAATVERYAAPLGGGHPALDEEEVAALLAGVKDHVEAFCSGFPTPFEGEEEDDEEEESVRKPASRAQRANRNTAPIIDDDSDVDDDNDQNSPALPRRKAAPRAAVAPRDKHVMGDESSSDDEDYDGPEMPPADDSDDDDIVDESVDDEDNEENRVTEAIASARKARRASIASVAALREALKENARIS